MKLSDRERVALERIYSETDELAVEVRRTVPLRTQGDLEEQMVRVIGLYDQAERDVRKLLGDERADEFFAEELLISNRLIQADPEGV